MLCVAASFDNVNRISETFTVVDNNIDDDIYDDDDDVWSLPMINRLALLAAINRF